MNPCASKTVVFILSTMRSGSTLLKALLAEAPDISHLPEINFQRFRSDQIHKTLPQLTGKPIVVLKRPAWFHEIRSYPKLPAIESSRYIVLHRDVHFAVESLKRMVFGSLARRLPIFVDVWLGAHYWSPVNCSLVHRFPKNQPNVRHLRYEDLLRNPVEVTRELFQFLGSDKTTGVDSYRKPENFHWNWGTDDAGPRIRTLRVQPPRSMDDSMRAKLARLQTNPRIAATRQLLGYTSLTPL